MDNQTLIIVLIVAVFFLGCEISCSGIQKENFAHNDPENCNGISPGMCTTLQTSSPNNPIYKHCCNGAQSKPIVSCDKDTINYEGAKQSCSQCIGLKAGQEYSGPCYSLCKCKV